jgi:murein DD-endopeptidase MepM/ murein hydrolase activator NlpD
VVSLLLVLPGISAATAWYLASSTSEAKLTSSQPDDSNLTELQATLLDYRSQLDTLKRQADTELDVLSLQLGRMQAQLMRSNALGQRLAEMAGLEKTEFDFTSEPALGGPMTDVSADSVSVTDFRMQLDELAARLEQEHMELTLLENLMMQEDLHNTLDPRGWPVDGGYISSLYGYRNDPFSGKRAFHRGVDIPAAIGTSITSLAAGMVLHAGKEKGFGKMVEIDHGNGYVTRYAHVSKIAVRKGQRVDKGQKIAEIGSSGRSTGPHLHLEVLKDGKTINPRKRLNAASRNSHN